MMSRKIAISCAFLKKNRLPPGIHFVVNLGSHIVESLQQIFFSKLYLSTTLGAVNCFMEMNFCFDEKHKKSQFCMTGIVEKVHYSCRSNFNILQFDSCKWTPTLHSRQSGSALKWVVLAVSPLYAALAKYIHEILTREKFTKTL